MKRSWWKWWARRPRVWPPESHATIDRLAFLAAQPYLLYRPPHYGFACEVVVGELSVEERRALRESGALPSWFYDDLERKVKDRRAYLRAAGF
jgi:hypothetical protein